MADIRVQWCACDPRLAASAARQFQVRTDGLWVDNTIPRRRMSTRARYEASGRGTYEDHTGEPYTFQCCPWCFADLPGLYPGAPTRSQADGGEGPE